MARPLRIEFPGAFHHVTARGSTAVQWNSLNLPSCMDAAGGTCTAGANYSKFSYSPSKDRYLQTAMVNGVSETTTYVGGVELLTTGSSTQSRHRISAYGQDVLTLSLNNSSCTNNVCFYYTNSDHLDSVDAVTDVNGGPTNTAFSFNASGARRDPTSGQALSAAQLSVDRAVTHRGFTKHEMLDGLGLVHMNGRVYDQNLGRFLSVDPVFQAPHNGQSLNPYSYVMNNPLSLVDPSGYASSDCPSNNSCPDKNDTTGSANQINGRAEKVAPTGSHIMSSVRISAIVGGKRVDITIDSNNRVVAASGVIMANGASHAQGAGDGIRIGQTSDTAPSNETAGAAAGVNNQTALVNNDGKGNITLTKAGEAAAIAVGNSLPSPTEENESYKLINDAGQVTQLQHENCSNKQCTVDLNLIRNPVIEVHDHQNDPSGGVANEGRAWPGPGDQNIVMQQHIINVFKGNDGAVRVIEERDGRPVVRTLSGGDSKLNSYIQRNWQPYRYPGGSMSDSAVARKQQEFDDGHQ